MKLIKKILIVTLVFSFLLSTMVGCGAGTDSKATTTATDKAATAETSKAEPVEIQFWDMSWGPKEYIEKATQLVDQYNQQNKGVKVNYQSTPWSNWYQTFSTAIASGSAPDISTGAGYQAFQFSKIGAILPIDDVVADLKSSGKISDFAANSVELMKYNDHYVALPWMEDIRVMWYRKDLFTQAGIQAPKNWTEFRTAAKKLTKDDVFGFVISGKEGWQVLLSFMYNNGGGLFDKDKNLVIENDRNKEALKYLSDLAKDGSLNPAGAGFTGDDAVKAFVSGKAAMCLAGPGLDIQYPDIKDKVALLDPLEGLHGDKGTISWANNIMLYKDGKHPEEAKEFLKWWSENQKILWTEGGCGGVPIRKTISDDPYFKQNENVNKILTQYVPVGKSTATGYPGLFPELNEIEGDSVLNIAIQGIMLKKDSDQILKDIQIGIEKIMEKAK